MPSLKSHILLFVMRHSHLLHFRLKKETWDENISILRFREECEKGGPKVR